MRVVLASSSSLPSSVGGAEVHVHALARAFRQLGHEASILTIDRVGGDSVAVHPGSHDGITVDYLTLPSCISKYDRDVRLVTWAERWLRAEEVQVLHLFLFSHLLGLVPAARRLGIPVFLTALEFSYFCRRYDMLIGGAEPCALGTRGRTCEDCTLSSYSGSHRMLASACRVLPTGIWRGARAAVHSWSGRDYLLGLGELEATNQIEAQRQAINEEIAGIIAPSTVMHRFFRAHGTDPERLHLIPYGTDVDGAGIAEGTNSTTDKTHRPSSTILRVAFVGRLDPKKGPHLLCEAVQMLPRELGLRVSIFGPEQSATPEYLARLRKLIESDPRIFFGGSLDRRQLAERYREIDVLVVPSLWYENSPITVSEALAFGRPVICTDTDGMTDLVRDDVNGLTFRRGDVRALAECLRRLVVDEDLLPKLRRGIQPPESTGSVARSLLELYDRALNGRPRAQPEIHA